MAPNGGITIRMYRVGFGDCFLLSLPVARETRHILIDCGVHSQGDIHSLKDVVANIASVTSHKLAVVIATHAHQDHLAGFATPVRVPSSRRPQRSQPRRRRARRRREC